MKILCYSAKLVAGLNADSDPVLAKRFAIISSKISGARATLRLIDDIPMLQYTLEYGLGSKVCGAEKQTQWMGGCHFIHLFIFIESNRLLFGHARTLTHSHTRTHSNIQETDTALSIIGVITNAVDHIYYPIEKICWLAEHKAITVDDPDRWDTISSIFWVSSIYLNLMRYTFTWAAYDLNGSYVDWCCCRCSFSFLFLTFTA